AIKRLMRPYLQYQGCLNQMTIKRLEEQHERLARLTAACEQWNETWHGELERQGERLRTELIQEWRRPGPTGDAAEPVGAATRSVAAGAKLILGTIAVRRPGYVHISPTSDGSADLAAPLDCLPVAPASAAEIVVANTLELFPAREVRNRLL